MQGEEAHNADPQSDTLATLGAGIRERRRQLRVSATATAEAAGLSRVTLHRIERGEPSVAMGLYQRAITALGLTLHLTDAQPRTAAPPEHLRLADLPALRHLAWQLDPATELTPKQALDLYERNWRHLDTAAMTPHERTLLDRLVHSVGGGRLLV
jgi:transcriptional regulator with XRE-family HTH domain